MKNRLPEPFGLYINRRKNLSFSFEGKTYEAYEGDTVASALAANNQWIISRSFKYHRPRGVLSMAGLDGNTLIQLKDEPNVMADRLPVTDKLETKGINRIGTVNFDLMGWLKYCGRFLPAGFYYRAFYKPKFLWPVWDWLIRHMAGLGKVNKTPSHKNFDKQYLFCDVAIVGGGPAGMTAALQVAESGAEVILIDDAPQLGGALNYARFEMTRPQQEQYRDDLISRVKSHANIRVLNNAVANGLYEGSWLAVIKDQRLYKLRSKQTLIATGTMEQPAVFRNNDLPGVMLSSAAQRLIHLYGVCPGQEAVVVTGNIQGYYTAIDLADAGVKIAAIVDLRNEKDAKNEKVLIADLGAKVLYGHRPVAATGTRHVESITVTDETGTETQTIPCDLLTMAVGFTPNAALICHQGSRLEYNDGHHMLLPPQLADKLPDHCSTAGGINGLYGLDNVVADGYRAGVEALEAAGFETKTDLPPPSNDNITKINYPWPIFPHPEGKEFIDYDEDITIRDVHTSIADGFGDIELLKRYSTIGMGPSQGRQSALNTVRLTAQLTEKNPTDIDTTTVRPPYIPEHLGALAGQSFSPERLTAMHDWHVDAGAQMMVAGAWWRPAYYGRPEQRDTHIEREAVNVRQNIGLIDLSTLGKLEIRGSDAAEFINRMYTMGYKGLAPGKIRYALMLDEAGTIIDDGVACRLHENHYYVTATTGGADHVYRQMLWFNAQWRLNVDITNVTSAYSAVNLAGPKSRQLLEKVVFGVDLSPEVLPYMAVTTGTIEDIPVRILRIGFVGELGYEIHCPSAQGLKLWEKLMDAGRKMNIKPFGVEAQRLLRLEKGHIIVGQDTDALTNPLEADMNWAIGKKKPFFVGQAALRALEKRELKRKLVGFTLLDRQATPPKEGHLTLLNGEIIGRVTSAARSQTLKQIIGLAYVAPAIARSGQYFDIKLTDGQIVKAEVTRLPFYDDDNRRQEAG